MARGESRGLRTLQFTTQADFLAALGIGELLVEAQAAASDPESYAVSRQGAISLLDPAGMGGFRVLVQERR
jgi:SAM-dependent MidA family methyltransferase